MKTFKHSGTLGDLIYSLPVVEKMGGGEFKIAIGNVENVVDKYRASANEQVDPAHRGRFTEKDFDLLAPLLERQPYITKVSRWYPGDAEVDVDLDRFRGVLFRGFEGNYNEAYHRTFGIPFTAKDYEATWLEADPKRMASIIVVRSARYRSTIPDGNLVWTEMARDGNLSENGLFIGSLGEHEDFVRTTGCNIPYYDPVDFKEMADIIAGADFFMGNQSFQFSLAMGLGKDAVLETFKIKPLVNNECYWHQRPGVEYF